MLPPLILLWLPLWTLYCNQIDGLSTLIHCMRIICCCLQFGTLFTKKCYCKLYVRCKKSDCRARFNVSDFSVFIGIRLALRDLLWLIHYGRVNKSRFPLVNDAQSQLHLGRTRIQHVFDSLRYTKTLAGKTFSRSAHKLAGAVKGDGRALRKIYVSQGNATFACQVEEATARWKKQNGSKRLPKYWLGHVRIAGGASAVHVEFASPVHAHRFTRLCTRSSAVHAACSAVHAACSAE